MTKVISPGDIIISSWGCTKERPWVVLWVDDDHGEVCVAAVTTQSGFPGVIKTGDTHNPYIGSWVMVQPLHIARCHCKVVGKMPLQEVRRTSNALAAYIDLGGHDL